MTNPIDKIDPLPNKTSRYFSLLGFLLVGIVLLYIAGEQVNIGHDLDHALTLILYNQEQDEHEVQAIFYILNQTSNLLNSSIDEINLTESNYFELLKNKEKIIDILHKQNITHDGINEIRNILKTHANLTE